MTRITITFFLFGITFLLSAQDAENKTDKRGRKQGKWEKKYENGAVEYTATFKDDVPVGTMLRFYEDSTVKAEFNYVNKSLARAKIFYPNKFGLMAEGNYFNEKRDSIWLFYTPQGDLASSENYTAGEKNGLTIIYYNDGAIAEKIHYRNGVKHGKWEQYFEDGQQKLSAEIENGISYKNEYKSYYPDGSILEKGKFLDGKKESSWYLHNDDGSIQVITVYRNGKVEEEYRKNGVFEDYWPNDIKRSEYTYKKGLKDGPFKEYYNKGEWRTEEAIDEFGEKRAVQRLYGTQILKEGKYLEGELHGEIITYRENGKVDKRENFNRGVLQD